MIQEKLNTDMKQAMKDKDKQRLSVIRQLIAFIQRKTQDAKDDAIKKGQSFEALTEQQVTDAVQTFKKQTLESLEGFKTRGDEAKIAELEEELKIISNYLPEQMPYEQVVATVAEVAEGLKTKGEVMKRVMPILKGKADNAAISKAVDAFLSSLT